jgi:predicted transcriptional regulator of viral defense system
VTSNPDHPAVLHAREKGLIRASELSKFGASGAVLQKLLETDQLVRISRGVYMPANLMFTEKIDHAVVALKFPQIVFCLLTALQIHELTTQLPHQLWVAIGQKARAPKLAFPPLRVIRMSNLSFGLTTLVVDGGISIQVTNVAKTVADCFKYRNKVGIDVALEALRNAWAQNKVTMDEIWLAAEHCRVHNVMRPYMESLV